VPGVLGGQRHAAVVQVALAGQVTRRQELLERAMREGELPLAAPVRIQHRSGFSPHPGA
jgi:hypothetical protein